MSSYNLRNVSSNRCIVCTLKDGKTLRLFPKGSITLTEEQITDYLKELASNGKLLTITKLTEESKPIKKSANKAGEKEE